MRIGVLTGGGDCAGLNAAIRGVVLRAQDYNDEVVGIKEGWRGLINENFVILQKKDVEDIIQRGGTILGTSRTNPLKKQEDRTKVLNNVKKLGLECLIAIGGEDTLTVAERLYKENNLAIVGIPKTMDNDLSCTDYTFGFDSATTVAVEALERLKDTGKSHNRIMVLEVMGRHAGWVALFTGLGGGADAVLIPEVKPDLYELAEHIKQKMVEKGYATVVVAEGVELEGLESIEGKEVQKDEFGHTLLKEKGVGEYIAKLLSQKTGYESRACAIGHIQRGGSPTLFDRLLATRLAIKAVDMAHNGSFGKMATFKNWEIEEVELSKAVEKLKLVPKSWYELIKILCK